MGWLRAHLRVGATVALLAMALQLADLFGHVHLRDAGASHHVFKTQIAGAAGGIHGVVPDRGALPPDGDALCAICLVGHLASAAIAASAPLLALPVVHPGEVSSRLAAAPAFEIGFAFRSRGPPTV